MKEKALTVHDIYAFFICKGIKPIENRTWKTKHRGRVYIHAGASKKLDHVSLDTVFTDAQIEDLKQYYTENELCKMVFQKSAIIGHVDMIDCVENHSSVWALPNHYHWVLANPVLFEQPIEDVKGKLSLWDCSEYLVMPDHISANDPLSEETNKMLQKVVRQAYKTK